MIMLGYADIADTAMLASSRFEEMAGATDLPWLVQDVIIRIAAHFLPVVFRSDHRIRRCHTLISEDVRQTA